MSEIIHEPSFAKVTADVYERINVGDLEGARILTDLATAIAANNQAKADIGLNYLWRLQ